MTFTLATGRTYRAAIHLGFFERIASNEMIAGKLRDAGFVDVVVTGDGADRCATGEWGGETQDADLPAQIKSMEVMP